MTMKSCNEKLKLATKNRKKNRKLTTNYTANSQSVNQFITIAAEYAGKLQSIKVHIHK